MGDRKELGSKTANPKAVYDEIVAAFRDSHWVPVRYYREDFEPDDDVASRFDYIVNKSWLEIAGDAEYLAGYISEEFFFMAKECFLYCLPGYLLGVNTQNFASTALVAQSVLRILSGDNERPDLFPYLMEKLTTAQKTAIAHWLGLQHQRAKAGELTRHMAYYCEAALPKWKEWGAPPPDDAVWSQYPQE
jgi:hypothetical protein